MARIEDSAADTLSRRLATASTGSEKYDVLHELGHQGNAQWAAAVEPYLESPSDPMLARLALEVLCVHWRLANEYRDHIVRFLQGIGWYNEEDVRQIAVYAAGEMLAHAQDRELLALLVRLAETDDRDTLVRDDALFALARAAGYPWQALPSVSQGLSPESELGRRVLHWAHDQLSHS